MVFDVTFKDEMYYEGKLKLRSHNTSYCLIEVVTKAGLTVFSLFSGEKTNLFLKVKFQYLIC
jgi:hypothetical protein